MAVHRNHLSSPRHRPANTLMEVLVAFFMLALTAQASAGLIIQSYKTSGIYNRNFRAQYMAREVIEHIHMIRNTNAMRFADPQCWDTKLEVKKCTKQNLEPLVQANEERHLALVTLKPEDMYFRLVDGKEQQGTDALQECAKGTHNVYAIYQHKPALETDPYAGITYGTDGPAPADQKPLFCRRITLSKTDNDNEILIKIEILSKEMLQPKVFREYIINDAL